MLSYNYPRLAFHDNLHNNSLFVILFFFSFPSISFDQKDQVFKHRNHRDQHNFSLPWIILSTNDQTSNPVEHVRYNAPKAQNAPRVLVKIFSFGHLSSVCLLIRNVTQAGSQWCVQSQLLKRRSGRSLPFGWLRSTDPQRPGRTSNWRLNSSTWCLLYIWINIDWITEIVIAFVLL